MCGYQYVITRLLPVLRDVGGRHQLGQVAAEKTVQAAVEKRMRVDRPDGRGCPEGKLKHR